MLAVPPHLARSVRIPMAPALAASLLTYMVLYLFAAVVLARPIGLLLALIPQPVYDVYERAPRTWGPSPLGDGSSRA